VCEFDLRHRNNQLYTTEYLSPILKEMLRKETLFLPTPDYMDTQAELKPKMRGQALEWISEVAHKFKLLPETLFLAINYMDRFLSQVNVVKGDLQLVLVTALEIASKYEEIYPPSLEDYIFICDNAYTSD